jgi:hypothetical protein
MAMHADWRQVPVAYVVLAIGALAVAMILRRSIMRIWKRVETIENQVSKMQNEIATLLQIQAALISSRSHPTTPAPREDPESAKSPG